jgi:hypothetical protein
VTQALHWRLGEVGSGQIPWMRHSQLLPHPLVGSRFLFRPPPPRSYPHATQNSKHYRHESQDILYFWKRGLQEWREMRRRMPLERPRIDDLPFLDANHVEATPERFWGVYRDVGRGGEGSRGDALRGRGGSRGVIRIFCTNLVWGDFWKRGDKYVAELAGGRGRRERTRGKRGPMFVKLSFSEGQNKDANKAKPSNVNVLAALCFVPRPTSRLGRRTNTGKTGWKPGARAALLPVG